MATATQSLQARIVTLTSKLNKTEQCFSLLERTGAATPEDLREINTATFYAKAALQLQDLGQFSLYFRVLKGYYDKYADTIQSAAKNGASPPLTPLENYVV